LSIATGPYDPVVEHLKNASSNKGPAELFTGDVWIDPIADGVNLVQF